MSMLSVLAERISAANKIRQSASIRIHNKNFRKILDDCFNNEPESANIQLYYAGCRIVSDDSVEPDRIKCFDKDGDLVKILIIEKPAPKPIEPEPEPVKQPEPEAPKKKKAKK